MDGNLAYKGSCGYQPEPQREELINGQWVAMAPATVVHSRIKGNIYRLFAEYLDGRECEALPDGTAVYLAEKKEYYYPDAMVVCDPAKIKYNGVHGAPDLVVEVLSPGTAKKDRGWKKNVYERCGVLEYWLVEPSNKSVEQYLLRDGHFVLEEVYTLYPEYMLEEMEPEERNAIQTEFKCSLYGDLVIRLEDIFRRVP